MTTLDTWISLDDVDDPSILSKIIRELHKPYAYIKRGRGRHRIRANIPPNATSPYRTRKMRPYRREVAGGGYKPIY